MAQRKRSLQLAGLRTPCDLAALLDLPGEELERLVRSVPQLVIWSSKKKAGGGRRPIIKAAPALKNLHELIKRKILRQVEFPSCVHGYCQGRSQITAALPHVGNPMLLTMDIQSFFPSIRPEQVRHAWQRLGCSPCVARMLTRLTTAKYQLPQGFRTSNFIANMVRAPLDKRMHRIAEEHGLTYTNFSDNLFLSGERLCMDVEQKCRDAARRYGWRLHDVALKGPGDPKVILNLEVRETLYVREAYLAETATMLDNIGAEGRTDRKLMLSIRGRIAYIKQVNAEQAKPLDRKFRQLMSEMR